MKKLLLAICLASLYVNCYAEECENVIALSKTVNTAVANKNSVDAHSDNYCNEYHQSKSSGKTMNASASYKFLSASFGSSNASFEDVASRYCSATSSFNKRDDAYKQYVESISPNAYAAYEQCIAMSKKDITFDLNPSSLLPKQFAMTVNYRPSSNAPAVLSVSASEDVTCNWGQGIDQIVTIQGVKSVDLDCKRNDESKKSFVKVTRTDGMERITFSWPRFNEKGEAIDKILDLQKQNSDLSNQLFSLEKSIKYSVVAFNTLYCPDGWSEYKPAYGRFVRGIDKRENPIDPDHSRKPGNLQEDSFKAHQHQVQVAYGPGGQPAAWSMTHNSPTSKAEYEKMRSEGGPETRPKNVALLYCERH